MNAYDQLPPGVRLVLAESVEDWATQPIRKVLRRGQSETLTINNLRRWEREELSERAYQRGRAIGPYKGNTPIPGFKAKRRKPK